MLTMVVLDPLMRGAMWFSWRSGAPRPSDPCSLKQARPGGAVMPVDLTETPVSIVHLLLWSEGVVVDVVHEHLRVCALWTCILVGGLGAGFQEEE